MDANIHWNVGLCNLMPAGVPFMSAGMTSICPLKLVTVFVLQLTRRRNPIASLIYLPLSYDITNNNLHVYIPPKQENTVISSLPYLISIDRQLKSFCQQFRNSGNPACVIAPAIRQLLSTQNLLMLH